MEFTPAAAAGTAVGAAPAAVAAVPAARAVPGTIQSPKGETHAATLILECLGKTGRKFDVTEALRMIAEGSDPLRELKSVQATVQLVFVGATRPTHLLVLAAHRDRGKKVRRRDGRRWLGYPGPHRALSFFELATDRVMGRGAQRTRPPGC